MNLYPTVRSARMITFTSFTLALLFLGAAAPAQTTQGEIAGNVLDATGAVIPNATVTAKSDQTGAVFSAVSSSVGAYHFPSVPLGRYTLTTTAAGFKSTVNTGVEVRVGSTTAFEITMSAGGANETITVQSDVPSIETQSSDVGGTVTTTQIVDLPLALGGVGAMRSPEAFVFLIPGTTGPGSGNSSNGIFINKLGGGQNFGNEILLDGASVIRTENGSSFDETAPSVEAVSEFKVTTSTPAAEFGRTTGGIENFVTKGGTNSFHGTAFDIFRNEDLNANDWLNNGKKAYYQSVNDPQEKNFNRGTDKKNDYGGSLRRQLWRPGVRPPSLSWPGQDLLLLCMGAIPSNPRWTIHEFRSNRIRADRQLPGSAHQRSDRSDQPLRWQADLLWRNLRSRNRPDSQWGSLPAPLRNRAQ
jgi:hypothetical protein